MTGPNRGHRRRLEPTQTGAGHVVGSTPARLRTRTVPPATLMAITIPTDSHPLPAAVHVVTRTTRWPTLLLLAAADRAPTSSRWPTFAAVGPILLLALGLRLWGLTWIPARGLHPDENHYAEVAAGMVRNGDPNPRYFQNPSLFTYLIAGQLLAVRALGPLAEPLGPDPVSAAFRLARLDGALLGTAGVGLAFLTGAAGSACWRPSSWV